MKKGAPERKRGSESSQTRKILQSSPCLQEIRDRIADYWAGFILVGENTASFLGSGTLVSIGETKAILTAGHVLDALPETGRVGLALPTRYEPTLGNEGLLMEHLTGVCFGRGENGSDGPDLGLLVLPNPVASRVIPSTKNFYNLLLRREPALDPQRAIDRDGSGEPASDGDLAETWILAGTPAESESDGPPESGFDQIKEFEGQAGLGTVVSANTAEGFDYLRFSAKYDENYEGPGSFEGFSGGSLWHLRGVLDEGEFIVRDWILSGVPFWQSEIAGAERIITCHGPKSIYERLIDKIQKKP